MPKQSSQKVGIQNVSKVTDYIKKTNLNDMPMNQYGRCSRSKICNQLGITPSTIGTNKDLEKAFNKIDELLGFNNEMPSKRNANLDEVKKLEQEISRLKNKVAGLRAENQKLNRQNLSEDFFISTGRVLRVNNV